MTGPRSVVPSRVLRLQSSSNGQQLIVGDLVWLGAVDEASRDRRALRHEYVSLLLYLRNRSVSRLEDGRMSAYGCIIGYPCVYTAMSRIDSCVLPIQCRRRPALGIQIPHDTFRGRGCRLARIDPIHEEREQNE